MTDDTLLQALQAGDELVERLRPFSELDAHDIQEIIDRLRQEAEEESMLREYERGIAGDPPQAPSGS